MCSDDEKKLEAKEIKEVLVSLLEQERHFNEIVSKYRLLVQSSLVIGFGALGFVLVKEQIADKNIALFLLFLMMAGVFIAWIIDIRVYQQLLSANARLGEILEEKLAELTHNNTPYLIHRIMAHAFKSAGQNNKAPLLSSPRRLMMTYYLIALLMCCIASIYVGVKTNNAFGLLLLPVVSFALAAHMVVSVHIDKKHLSNTSYESLIDGSINESPK